MTLTEKIYAALLGSAVFVSLWFAMPDWPEPQPAGLVDDEPVGTSPDVTTLVAPTIADGILRAQTTTGGQVYARTEHIVAGVIYQPGTGLDQLDHHAGYIQVAGRLYRLDFQSEEQAAATFAAIFAPKE